MQQINPTEFMIQYEMLTNGYFFYLKLEGDTLILKQFSKYQNKDEQIEIIPTPEEWLDFKDELSTIDIWGWYEEYLVKCSDSCVEGDEWEVKIYWDENWVESRGSNSYPSTFREMMKAVEELTGMVIEFIHQD
jgi:hypothetical protein